MNQKFSISMLAGGLPAFLLTATEIITHGGNTWTYFYATPMGALHLFVLGVSFATMLAGAIGTQLPRGDGAHASRKSDQVITPDSPDGTVTTITTTKETVPIVKETP